MSVTACPIAMIHAPLDYVWEFLSQPANYALWWDAQTQKIIPEGRAQSGQKIYAKTIEFGKSWDVTVTVDAVDECKHHIDLTTQLPFGITVYNHILCAALQDGSPQVSFGWDFAFSPVWWGWLLEHFAAKQLHQGVADALARLKRAAETT